MTVVICLHTLQHVGESVGLKVRMDSLLSGGIKKNTLSFSLSVSFQTVRLCDSLTL